jgi:hypothetical protein
LKAPYGFLKTQKSRRAEPQTFCVQTPNPCIALNMAESTPARHRHIAARGTRALCKKEPEPCWQLRKLAEYRNFWAWIVFS